MSLTQRAESTDSLSISDGNRSRHSSVRGPYREAEADTAFPLYCAVPSIIPPFQTYSLSLLPTRNGYGAYKAAEARGYDRQHPEVGASLGDIGWVDRDGAFVYFLNIFQPLDTTSIDEQLPPGFAENFPAAPLTTDERIISESHFSPGTALVSNGIKVTKQSVYPLQAKFETSEQRGAVLILPEGAMREELVDSSRIHHFIRDHAAPWYQYWNGGIEQSSRATIPNSTLYMVVGVDRAPCWSTAVFSVPYHEPKRRIEFSYISGKEKTPWERDEHYVVDYKNSPRSGNSFGAVFLRLMAIALSPKHWSQTIAYVPPDVVSHYKILSPPTSGLQALLKWTKRSKNKAPERSSECPFYPSTPILHVMLLMSPSAVVGLLDDSTWSSEISKHLYTHLDILELLMRIFANFDIINTDGIVTLAQKTNTPGESQGDGHGRWVQNLSNRISKWLAGRRGGHVDAEIARAVYSVLGISRPLLRG